MKKIKLILLITLLVMLITGCQSNAESTTDVIESSQDTTNDVVNETESTTEEVDVEEDIKSFISDFYNAVINNDEEFAVSCVESRVPEFSSEQFVKKAISTYFESNVKEAEILVSDYRTVKSNGEDYIVVNYSEKLTTGNGEINSSEAKWYLIKYEDTYKLLYKGFEGSTMDVLSGPFISNDNTPIDYMKISNYIDNTKLEMKITNKSGVDLGFGLKTLKFDVVVELKDGTTKVINYPQRVSMPMDKSFEFWVITDVPYDVFMENIQYIYLTEVNSCDILSNVPTIGEDSGTILLYSEGDNGDDFFTKQDTF